MRKSKFEDEKEFAEQWKVVMEKYPLVAMRFLELLNFVGDEWHRINNSFSAMFNGINLCDPDSPIQPTKEFCERLGDNDGRWPFPGHADSPECDRKEYSTVGGYNDCMFGRITGSSIRTPDRVVPPPKS